MRQHEPAQWASIHRVEVKVGVHPPRVDWVKKKVLMKGSIQGTGLCNLLVVLCILFLKTCKGHALNININYMVFDYW
jgi:hypothetical protein